MSGYIHSCIKYVWLQVNNQTILVIHNIKTFYVQFFRVFLISSASLRSLPFLSFIVPIFACNITLASLIFLRQSLVFPTLLFSSISLHYLLKKIFLSLFAILWNSAFSWVYLSLYPCLLLLLSQLFIRPPQTIILPCCISFSF